MNIISSWSWASLYAKWKADNPNRQKRTNKRKPFSQQSWSFPERIIVVKKIYYHTQFCFLVACISHNLKFIVVHTIFPSLKDSRDQLFWIVIDCANWDTCKFTTLWSKINGSDSFIIFLFAIAFDRLSTDFANINAYFGKPYYIFPIICLWDFPTKLQQMGFGH